MVFYLVVSSKGGVSMIKGRVFNLLSFQFLGEQGPLVPVFSVYLDKECLFTLGPDLPLEAACLLGLRGLALDHCE